MLGWSRTAMLKAGGQARCPTSHTGSRYRTDRALVRRVLLRLCLKSTADVFSFYLLRIWRCGS
jgi:hypothetical protein